MKHLMVFLLVLLTSKDSDWSDAMTPVEMGSPGFLFQQLQFKASTTFESVVKYWRNSFDLQFPTTGHWEFSLHVYVTQKSIIWINGNELNSTDQRDKSFYFRTSADVNYSLLIDGTNEVAIEISDGLYFNALVIFEKRCSPNYLGEDCSILDKQEEGFYLYLFTLESSSSSSSAALAITLGVALPVLFLGGLGLGLFFYWRFRKNKRQVPPPPSPPVLSDQSPGSEWEINYHELELGTKIGEGLKRI